jgi:hypothetical protein
VRTVPTSRLIFHSSNSYFTMHDYPTPFSSAIHNEISSPDTPADIFRAVSSSDFFNLRVADIEHQLYYEAWDDDQAATHGSRTDEVSTTIYIAIVSTYGS